ncbi:anion permease [Staphylococcus saccharolyticus]|jgi:anion transporter family protein|uniref:Divalent anion symporter n=1 Tax=Staphylococcus saccharolyticus TaxID=33028 RepID=A0A380H7E3_9STAP|nr:anion permease [Staphylococcus saccharolyticus]SUM73712.1 divalent anion symporter [Staphylococcus saccharolyticus]
MTKGDQLTQNIGQRQNKEKKGYKPIWIIISFVILITILLLPTPAGLPIMAKATLVILAFAVIMWVTEAVSYPVSATLILGLIILLLVLSPVQNLTEKLGNPKSGDMILKGSDILGTNNAFSGFSTSVVALSSCCIILSNSNARDKFI